MMIQVENLVKRYGDVMALDHFDLQIAQGEIFGLLGPNGSGKTTAINCMLSLLKYDRGAIKLFGKPMGPDAYGLKRDIGVVMQNVAVFYELTVYENISYFCSLYIDDKRQRQKLVEEAIEFVGLEDYRKFFARAPQRRPAPAVEYRLRHRPQAQADLFRRAYGGGGPPKPEQHFEDPEAEPRGRHTVVYTSHYMEEVEQICTRIMIMDKGKAVAVGTKEELKAMIGAGEKGHGGDFPSGPGGPGEIGRLPGVRGVDYEDTFLTVRFKKRRGTT